MSKKVNIGGIESSTETFESIAVQILNSVNNKSKFIFIHLNLHNFSILKKDTKLFKYISGKCMIFFEGIGMKIASYLTKQGWNNDTNGTDLFPLLFKKLSENNKSIYLLGGSQTVIEAAVKKINSDYPTIRIHGFHDGYLKESKNIDITENINSAAPDLLVLGMGMQNEIDFIYANYEKLTVGAIWCVGGLFDFISGNLTRAPKIIRKIRMEWAFRFLLEPKAKFQRTVITPFWFLKTALIEHYFKKVN